MMQSPIHFREPVLFRTVRLIEPVQKADSSAPDVIKQ